jgi:hypothetical protein
MSETKWIPEIFYQEDSQVPFIEVPEEEEMPEKLYMFEYKKTGKYEPGPDGEDVPICDMDIHIYFQYKKAKEVLDKETLDKVRVAFGLETLDKAMEKGRRISASVSDNADLK